MLKLISKPRINNNRIKREPITRGIIKKDNKRIK